MRLRQFERKVITKTQCTVCTLQSEARALLMRTGTSSAFQLQSRARRVTKCKTSKPAIVFCIDEDWSKCRAIRHTLVTLKKPMRRAPDFAPDIVGDDVVHVPAFKKGTRHVCQFVANEYCRIGQTCAIKGLGDALVCARNIVNRRRWTVDFKAMQ